MSESVGIELQDIANSTVQRSMGMIDVAKVKLDAKAQS